MLRTGRGATALRFQGVHAMILLSAPDVLSISLHACEYRYALMHPGWDRRWKIEPASASEDLGPLDLMALVAWEACRQYQEDIPGLAYSVDGFLAAFRAPSSFKSVVQDIACELAQSPNLILDIHRSLKTGGQWYVLPVLQNVDTRTAYYWEDAAVSTIARAIRELYEGVSRDRMMITTLYERAYPPRAAA